MIMEQLKKQRLLLDKLDENNVEITSGIKDGDQIICTNTSTLQDGDEVDAVTKQDSGTDDKATKQDGGAEDTASK